MSTNGKTLKFRAAKLKGFTVSLINMKNCWTPDNDHMINPLPYVCHVTCRLYNDHMNFVKLTRL